MERTYLSPEQDGFYGAYYPCAGAHGRAVIAMLGDSVDDFLAQAGVKWLHRRRCNVLAMSPAPKDYSHHNYPLERFGAAIDWLTAHGNHSFAVLGASTTGMLALLAAAYDPRIRLTIALSPSDFVMEGFYQENGIERPGNNESTVSWQGQPLPYLPFAYRDPEYWQQLRAESKRGGNRIASREMFDLSEHLHAVQEEEKIPIEKIRGRVIVVGAEDDCLWDTCRYIRRMQRRLATHEHTAVWKALTYEHCTHFVFPDSMLTRALPLISGLVPRLFFKAARDYPDQCRAARQDIDRQLTASLDSWH